MENSIKEDIERLKLCSTNQCYICGRYEKEECMLERNRCEQHILSDYKRVLKENEELKNDYENLSNSVVVKNHCIKNSIPVQKVKDKIEEYKKEKNKFGNCLVEFYENELADRDIKILQELLEKRK